MSPGKDKKAASRDYFDRHAASYERGGRFRAVQRPQVEALAWLGLRADDRLLDVGCGTGMAVRTAALGVARAVGLDLSPQMIAEARRLAQGVAGAEFEVGDGEQLPFADAEFTAVLCTTSLHHYPQPARAIAEMARVLIPGGRVVIGDPNRDRFSIRLLDGFCRRFQQSHVRILNSGELEAAIRGAGLVPAGFQSLQRGGYMLALARKPER